MIRTAIRSIICLLASAAALGAQEPVRQQATRAELQAQLERLEKQGDGTQAAAIRTRLRDGDFREGDRIYLRVIEEPTLTDSFTVRQNARLELPNLAPISLSGVLRSELEPFLRTEIGKVIRNPQVSATSFIRIAVLGGVVRPGFYQVPAETPVSQVVMVAGGPSADAKVEKSDVRRGDVVMVDARATRSLLASGISLDQANIVAGDEIHVGRRSAAGGSGNLVLILSAVAGLATAVVALTQ